MNALEKMKLNKALKEAIIARDNSKSAVQKLKLSKEVQSLREKLGLVVTTQKSAESQEREITLIDVNNIVPLNLNDDMDIKEQKVAVDEYLRQFQGKTLITSDGKTVRFSRQSRTHIISDVFREKSIIAPVVEHLIDVLQTGSFIGAQKPDKLRKDFTQFHVYRKWVDLKDKEVHVQVKVGELANGLLVAGDVDLLVYTVKDYEADKEKEDNREWLPSFTGDSVESELRAYYPHALSPLDTDSSCSEHEINHTAVFDKMQAETNADYPLIVEILEIRDKAVDNEAEGIDMSGDDDNSLIKEVKDSGIVVDKSTIQSWYEFDENRTKSTRQKENNAVFALLDKLESGELKAEDLTSSDKQTLAKYSGNGGGLKGRDGKVGSAHEYYTPAPIAQSMWDLVSELGFTGGKVLDPCAGTGIFGAFSPDNAVVDAIELDETSAAVNRYVNDKDGYSVQNKPFEEVAANTPDEEYDAIVTNVPFGDNTSRVYKGLDPKYRQETLEGYFVLRSLDKLKPRGIAAFLVPSSFMDGRGGKAASVRFNSSLKAEFIGAYRLPNEVFGTAGADVMTDIVVFRKYSAEAREKIKELQEQNPSVLREANVLWDTFLNGVYFRQSENKKYIIGTETQKENRYGKMAAAVSADGKNVAQIAKAIQQFGKSRINWGLLDAKETSPIVYNEGDHIYQDGQLFVYDNGQFVAQEEQESTIATKVNGTMAVLDSAVSAINNNVSFEDALHAKLEFARTSRSGEVPKWAARAVTSVHRLAKEKREKQWNLLLTGLAIQEAIELHGKDANFNYLDNYEKVSNNMKSFCRVSAESSLDKSDRDAIKLIKIHYKGGNYSDLWRGDGSTISRDFTQEQKIEALQYQNGSLSLAVDEIKRIVPDFDPLSNNDWTVSADGKVATKVSDMLVGNYADFLNAIDADIKNAATPEIASKLLSVKKIAATRVNSVNVNNLRFDIRSPLVTPQELQDFLKTLTPKPETVLATKDGKMYCDIDNKYDSSVKNDSTTIAKLQNRLGDHIKNGTLTLGSIELYDDRGILLSKEKSMELFRAYREKVNAQFNTWVHANPKIMERMESRANSPENLFFKQDADESNINIKGISKQWKLHGYQASFVRQQARRFGGVNGFGVGLGKTFTSLATVQYAHNVGTKKKTLFVLPNSVVSNWYKEAIGSDTRGGVYDETTALECLFVGADVSEDGTFSVDSKNYARDLNKILENKHSKVFMSQQAFEKIRMKEETAEMYQQYLASVDESYASVVRKAKDEKNKSRFAEISTLLTEGNGKLTNAPYFEDMGFDSIVIDEAHHFKNGKQVFEFGRGAKGLGNVNSPSARAIDMLAKTWFIRNGNARKDGILCLTATPITNSPLEIYSMMSLAAGEERVNSAILGAAGADAFMSIVCELSNEDDSTITGEYVAQDILKGLKNVDIIRNLIGDIAVIKNASDVGMTVKIPNANESVMSITLTKEGKEKLEQYKLAYTLAKELVASNRSGRPANLDAYQMAFLTRISDNTNEPVELLGQPFNLINKMDMLLLDEELEERATFYNIEGGLETVEKTIEEFNKLKIKNKRTKKPKWTAEEDILRTIIIKNEHGEPVGEEWEVVEKASITEDGRILLDSTQFETINKFETLLDKHKADVSVTISPKMAALVNNAKNEQSHVRAVDADGRKLPNAKQLIFCDFLAMHNKIKRVLASKAGIPASKITFVSGVFNSSADEILDVQNGFNANGDDNKYCVIIANKKAEVGINLQKGTQAIHHLTIAWTPDALTQRNGRGVRQGNATDEVNVYFYEADGTFDMYRRNLVDKKGEWINNLMDMNQDGIVEISGGLTNEQYDEIIRMDASAEGMAALQLRMQEIERQNRISKARISQITNKEMYDTSQKTLENNKDFSSYVKQLVKEAVEIAVSARKAAERYRISVDKNSSQKTIDKNKSLYDKEVERLEPYKTKLNDAYKSMPIKDAKWETMGALLDEIIQKGGRLWQYGFFEGRYGIDFNSSSDFDNPEHINENALVRQEYDNLVTQNQRIMESAKKSMLRDAQDVEGAFTPKEVGYFLEKKYIQLGNGRFAFPGMFSLQNEGEKDEACVYLTEDKVYLIYTSADSYNAIRSDELGRSGWLMRSFVNNEFKYRDTPEFERLLEKLGDRDTRILEKAGGNEENLMRGSDLAYKAIPEVSSYVKEVEKKIRISRKSRLMSPYFPAYLDESNLGSSAGLFKTFIEKQQELGIVKDGYSHLLVPERFEDLFDTTQLLSSADLLDILMAYGIKMENESDLSGFVEDEKWFSNFLTSHQKEIQQLFIEKAEESSTSEEELTEFLNQELEKRMSQFVITIDEEAKQLIKNIVKNGYAEVYDAWRKAHNAQPRFVYLTGAKTYHFSKDVGKIGLRSLAERYDCKVAWSDSGKGKYEKDMKVIAEAGINIPKVWVIEYKLWQLLQRSYSYLLSHYDIQGVMIY